MTFDEEQKLRELAAAATPGERRVVDCRHQKNGQVRILCDYRLIANVLASGGNSLPDAEFIAATSPGAVLELLDEIQRLRAEVDVWAAG